ncbi:MAG: hypothetical protein IJI54_15690 [Kiritimatiellae bacterium]|nr:hypothetical protein [Kiritimatiellia bacterium]
MGQNGVNHLTMRQRIAPSFFCREQGKGKTEGKKKMNESSQENTTPARPVKFKSNVPWVLGLIAILVITGCVSIEDQLNSQDPNVRVQGEYRLLTNARLSGKPEEVVSAINRIQTKSLLLEIAKNASQKRIGEGQAALSKLTDEKDFATLACSAEAPQIRRMAFAKVSKQETFLAICTQAGDPMIRKFAMDKLSPDNLAKLPYSSALLPYWKKITDQKTLAKIYRDGCGTFPREDLKAIAEKIDDEAILGEMVIPPPGRETAMAQRNRENEIFKLSNEIKELRNKAEERNRDANRAKKKWDLREEKRARREVSDMLTQISQTQKRLDLMENSPVTGLYITNDAARTALYGRIKNADVFGKIVSATDEYGCPLFKTREQFAPIFKRMPEDKALEFALEKLKNFGIYHWSENNLVPLEIAAGLASVAKDSKTRVQLAESALGALEAIKAELVENRLRYMFGWYDSQESFATDYAQSFKLSESEKVEILIKGGRAARRVVKIAGEETARKALASGRSLGRELEEKLVAKIPANKIDIPLYESVKPGTAKAALYEKMPENMKDAAKASLKRSFAAVEAKAKAAAPGTFELAGFYLGMSLDDLETVLAYHFPRLEFSECRDEDGYEKEKGSARSL